MPVTPLSPPIYTDVRNFVGDPNVPNEIHYQRKSSIDVYNFIGTPILIKRMYTIEDVENGNAIKASSMDDTYEQPTYAYDEISYGVGLVSVETQPGEWYGVPPGGDPTSPELISSPTAPYPNFKPAPRYRGYGPGFLTYAILPDRPEDQWKLTEQGALIRQQTAMAQYPWWPQLGDNDIVIIVTLDPSGRIAQTHERYQLKMVSPITMHGIDNKGYREFEMNTNSNRYVVGQQSELTKIPTDDQLYQLEVDR